MNDCNEDDDYDFYDNLFDFTESSYPSKKCGLCERIVFGDHPCPCALKVVVNER